MDKEYSFFLFIAFFFPFGKRTSQCSADIVARTETPMENRGCKESIIWVTTNSYKHAANCMNGVCHVSPKAIWENWENKNKNKTLVESSRILNCTVQPPDDLIVQSFV